MLKMDTKQRNENEDDSLIKADEDFRNLCFKITSRNMEKSPKKKLFPKCRPTKLALRPSMIDRACLKSAVLSSTPMTINKANAFTPHNCQSYSPIDNHLSMSNRKEQSGPMTRVERLKHSEVEDKSSKTVEEELTEISTKNSSKKLTPRLSKGKSLNDIVEKLADPNKEENHNVLNKTAQTTFNSCGTNVSATNRLVKSFSKCKAKERQTQTGLSLENNMLLHSPSTSGGSEGMSIRTFDDEDLAVNAFKKGGSVSLCNDDILEEVSVDDGLPWRAPSRLDDLRPVQEAMTEIINSSEDYSDDTFLPRSSKKTKVFHNKKKVTNKKSRKSKNSWKELFASAKKDKSKKGKTECSLKLKAKGKMSPDGVASASKKGLRSSKNWIESPTEFRRLEETVDDVLGSPPSHVPKTPPPVKRTPRGELKRAADALPEGKSGEQRENDDLTSKHIQLSTKRKCPARKNKPNVTSHPRLNLLSMTEEDPVETSNTSRPGNNVTVKSRARRTSPKKRGRTSDKKSPTGPETWEQPTADVLGSPVLDDSAVHKNTKKTLPGDSKRMEDVSRKLFPLEELATSEQPEDEHVTSTQLPTKKRRGHALKAKPDSTKSPSLNLTGGAVGPSKGRPSKKTRALPVDRVGGRTENVIGSPPLGDHTRGQKKTRPKKKKALLDDPPENVNSNIRRSTRERRQAPSRGVGVVICKSLKEYNSFMKGLYTNPNALKEVQRVSERRNSRRDNSRATNKTSITSVSGGGTLPPIEELENTEFDVSQVTESVSPKSRKKPNESQNTSRRTNPKKNVLSGRVAKRQRVSDVNKQITTSLNSLSNTVMEEMNDVINICNNGQVRRMKWCFRNVKYEKTKSLPGISTAVVEGFDDGGFLKIDPKKNKPKQTAMQHRMLFTVISGRARVRVLDKSDTLEKESMFVVPKGGEYSIKNLDSQEPLVLSFARLSRS